MCGACTWSAGAGSGQLGHPTGSRRPGPAQASCWAYLMGLSSTLSPEASLASHCRASWMRCFSSSEHSLALLPTASCSLRSPARCLLSA